MGRESIGRVVAVLTVLLVGGAVGGAGCNCSSGNGAGGRCTTTSDCDDGLRCVRGTCAVQGDAGEPGCMDLDQDGRGEGCAAGPDCDDGNPTQTGTEACDREDNDCDGEVDEGVLSACGDCDPLCMADGRGVGTGQPFDLETDENDGVGLDDEGALVLDSLRINTNVIWIANTTEATVSKFDTRTFEELGRYRTGPAGGAPEFFEGDDPSRTSVNTLGDVYVGNRNGNAVTRISVLGSECPDANGDGTVNTSTGTTDVKPWGEDECVLWHTDMDDHLRSSEESPERYLRAVAAQDVEGLDGTFSQYVWVGGYDTRRVAKLDGETGEVLLVTDAPVRPYGFALDAAGNLWMSTREDNLLGRIDTTVCVDDASCAATVCDGEGEDCDTAVKQRIPSPDVFSGSGSDMPYGITADFNQRVWMGGGTIMRYDPSADPGSRWSSVDLPDDFADGDRNPVRGVAADAEGWIWGAGLGGGIVRVDADDTSRWTTVEGTAGPSNYGMAVDAEGKVWSIARDDQAVVVTPGGGLTEATVQTGVATTLVNPYTYSDMTGLQLRLATNPRGIYRHLFEGCEGDITTQWEELRFDVEVVPGTSVTFRIRTADTREALDTAEWLTVANIPPDESPVVLTTALEEADITPGRLLMLEVLLHAERVSTDRVITPRVRSMNVTHVCAPLLN